MAPLPKGGCQNRHFGTDFDWGILHSALYNLIDIFAYASEISCDLIIRYPNHNQTTLLQFFCSELILFVFFFLIVLRSV